MTEKCKKIIDLYQTYFFLSKVIEKVISIRILGHIIDKNIVDSFQSAYRADHSCETALLRVYNDIVTTVGKGNGSFLVLLDLSAAFDTNDHDNLFYILEKYVGIGGSALRLIRSYFSDRTQRVQIDGMSDFASLLCGVPQGSVLGPMKFCLYNNNNNIFFYSANIQLDKNLFNALYKITCVQVHANYYI